MSGGSYDYTYCKIIDMADSIGSTPIRRAFAKHLRLVAQACHDIEWVDSGDCRPGDEVATIKAALGKCAPALVLAEVIEDAKRINAELAKAIREAGKEGKS